jgi:exopolysaccharide biosynthesis polyprenyl glycosylphosphotransferase
LKKTYHLSWFVIADFIGSFVAWLCFFSSRKIILGEQPENILTLKILLNAGVVAFFWIILYFLLGLYKDLYRKSRVKDAFALLGTNLLGAVIIFFLLLLDDTGVTNYTEYYKTFGIFYLLQTFFSVFSRVVVISGIKRLIRKKSLFFNTIIVGSDKNAVEIYEEFRDNHEYLGLRILGYVKVFDNSKDLLQGNLRCFGDYTNLQKLIRRCYVEQVIIAIEAGEYTKIQGILNDLQSTRVRIGIIPDVYQLLLGSVKINQLLGVPLIEINQDLIPYWQRVVKRGIDIVFSLLVLILGFPFFIFIAILTKMSSPGPVFYMQERIGKDARPFRIVKFRSMRLNAEHNGPALASKIDTRITGWGRYMRRFRLDELPQFWNVLKGDMSLVGPRPERQYFIDQILEKAPEYRHLHKVRPGLTSLGQVKFGYAENVDEMVKRLRYDILYIENLSLAMDFRILMYTVLIILQGRGK